MFVHCLLIWTQLYYFSFFFPVQSKPARPAAAEGDKSDGNRDPAAHQDVQED